jgi:DNA-binding MarR family transcriptional regulator
MTLLKMSGFQQVASQSSDRRLMPNENALEARYQALSVPCACATLRRANRAVTQLYDLVLAPVGIKATQFMALKSIFEAGEIAQCVYAREYGIAIETLSRRLGSLRRKGLVKMRRGDHHGERLYRITESGLELLFQAMPYWERAQYRLRTRLGEDGWHALLQMCECVSRAAKEAEQFRVRNDLQFVAANYLTELRAGTH